MLTEVNGGEWAWIAAPAAALFAGIVKYGGRFFVWLRAMEREAGKASEYQRHSTEAVVALKEAIAAKDAEIAALRETIASSGKEGAR